MPTLDPERAREKAEENLARIGSAARSFRARAKSQAGVELGEVIDPDGEAIAALVDVEKAPGAASLAEPMSLITLETWILGHLGDRDELDLDVNTHRDAWFSLGCWLGEMLRERHGGFWLFGGDDPRSWRLGFVKILLEVVPHTFAEKLIRSGHGLGKRMVSEIERLRLGHVEQAKAEGGAADRFTPQHYARLHTVPLAQWLVLDMGRLGPAWRERPASELTGLIVEAAPRLPRENAPALDRIALAIGKLEPDKPAAAQSQDRGLFEAVAQILALRRATPPIAADLLEKIVLPALHVGVPKVFPPLGDDDLAAIRKGTDLFAVYVDVVPYAHPAEEGGFLGTFSNKELSTPYGDRANLELGRGDWLLVQHGRLHPMLERFDPRRMLARFDEFVTYVGSQPGVSRARPHAAETTRGLAEMAARALADLRACVAALEPNGVLVFRLLPPAQ